MHRTMEAKHWIFIHKLRYISKHRLAKTTTFYLHVYCPNRKGRSWLLHVRLCRNQYTYLCNKVNSKVQSVI